MSGDARPDLRMPAIGAAAWLAVIVVLRGPAWSGPALVGSVAALWWWRRRSPVAGTLVAVLLATTGAGVAAGLRDSEVSVGPVAALAEAGASVHGLLTVSSDPRRVQGRYADRVLLRGTLREVTGRGRTWRVRATVVVLADPSWRAAELGARARVAGRLAPADGDASALLLARGSPDPVAPPGPWWRGAEAVRASLRESVAHRPADQRALVPALVDGDDAGVSDELAASFRTTGLTHLLAVSGTNLTLLVGFLLVLARGLGVRGRWLLLVGALGIVGFVLLARTEPSVVRAAAMGTVALVGLGRNGLQRGTRGLGVAVFALLLLDPWLALSVGFALSVLATAGILFLAPAWRDSLAGWMPRWLAEVIAIPAAAQLACTPVVAAISGEVSLVAVVANLFAAPVVGPATVLGLAGGLLGLVWAPLGPVPGTVASWCVGWIVLVAETGSSLPTASVSWGTGPGALLLLTLACVLVALGTPYLLRGPVTGLACAVLCVLVVVTRPPTPGWPPEGWVVAACDVGQGDALVLRAGPRTGVVVDAGPDPRLVDDCLRRLEVDRVPLVVLTHPHADHVAGLAGVLAGRETVELDVSPVVGAGHGIAGVVQRVAGYGEVRTVGDVRLQVVGPVPGLVGTPVEESPGEEGSEVNDASVVLLAEVRGVRVLLTGDVEPAGQQALADSLPGLEVDVVKVPHHGSRHQDLDFLLGLRARVALVSVGEENSYGHPSPETLGPLAASGAVVARTDTSGDVLVCVEDGRLVLRTRE